jgi:CheY-like chemotaxis protein
MPGEAILVIDDSTAVQDLAATALRGAGYRVTTASNGAAALAYPSIEDVDLVVLDAEMDGLSGRESARYLKQNGATHPIPILMLVPDRDVPDREDLEIAGANSYLLKPFDGRSLLRKVEQIFEQGNLDDLARQYLSDAADRKMTELAEQQITQAIERKTQIIVERCIQNVINIVDSRARTEVDSRIASLVSEKEQELVRMTVHEVANSMVEKLAASKVEEAMQTILREETEKAVRRATDKNLPNQIRDKIKEMLANILPREVEAKLQRAAEKMVPELSQQIVGTVEAVAAKTVPRSARELLPPVVENQVAASLATVLPRQVSDLVARELGAQLAMKFEPAIREAAARLRRSVMLYGGLISLILVVGVALGVYFFFIAPK